MPTYPRIKLIPDTIDKDEITVREGDLISMKGDRIHGTFRFMEEDLTSLAEVRAEGELKGKALYLNTRGNREPKIVIDSQGQTCLIFIKKKER